MDPRENDYYSFKVKERKKNRRKYLVVVASLIVTVNGQSSAYGVEQSDSLKLYAHSRIVNDKQYQCFYQLITRESNWRVEAKNGSHYGIGQMKNENYRKLDGYRQVDWSIRYIKAKHGSMCNAWRHFLDKGWH